MPQITWLKHVPAAGLSILLVGCASFLPQGDSRLNVPADVSIDTSPQVDTAAEQARADYAEVMTQVIAGELAGKLGDVEQSKQRYAQAARVTADPNVVERATRIAVFAKDWPLALESAEHWAELQPESVEAQQVLGVLYLQKGNIDQSASHFGQVLDSVEDGSGRGYRLIAATLARMEDTQSVLTLIDKLALRQFENPYGHLAYASLAMQAKDYRRAVDESELAIGFAPDLVQARIVRAQALSAIGELDSAFTEMQSLVEADPENFDLRLGYARMLLQSNRYKEADTHFRYLSTQRPNDPDILYTLGLIGLQLGDHERAEKSFHALRDKGYRVAESYFYLGRIEEARGEFEQAIDLYQQVPSSEFYIDANVRVAMLVEKLFGTAQAQQYFEALRSKVDTADRIVALFLAEGQMLIGAEQYQQAYDLYSEGLREFPHNIDLLYARALSAESIDRVDLLEVDLQTILGEDPDNVNALNALGYTWADRGMRLEQAQEYIQRAYALRPDDPAIVDSMGWVEFRLGNLTEAETYLRKALSLLDDAEIIGHLGELLWAQGNYEEARNLLRSALERHPDDEYILRLIKLYAE